MKKRFDVGSYIALIVMIGVISSLFTSDLPIRAFFDSLGSNKLEVTLENLNIGLAFVAFGFLFFYIISVVGRQDEDQGDRLLRDWEKNQEDDN